MTHFRPAGLRKPGIENKMASSIALENVRFQWLNFCFLKANVWENQISYTIGEGV